MGRQWQTSWWQKTGDPLVWEDGIGKPVYRNLDTGEKTHELPIGALFVSEHGPKGPDGLSVVCIIPVKGAGSSMNTTWWHIDSRASNCTMKDDTEHRCWVRHGSVCDKIHVDKNGHTCRAGAGSIGVPGFHGFLHHGILRDA